MIRCIHLAPPLDSQYSTYVNDDYLPYKPAPLSRVNGRSPTNEFDYDYTHNSQGFRDVEHVLDKPPGVFRILGLGDSFTYGIGTAYQETYLVQLETTLNARSGKHPRVEIIKAGIPAYYPTPERLLLEHYGAAYQPDLIIIGFLPNDVTDMHLGPGFRVVTESGFLSTCEAAKIGGLGTFLYLHSHISRILLQRYINFQLHRNYPTQMENIYHVNGMYEAAWQQLEKEYEAIHSIVLSLDATMLIVHIPQKGPWHSHHDYPSQRIGSWSEQRRVEFVDILPEMKHAANHEDLYYRKDGHCRPAGYAMIAKRLYEYLIRNHLIP